MIDIIEQKRLNIKTESKMIVTTNNLEEEIVKTLNQALDGLLETKFDEDVLIFVPFEKIKAKKIMIINHKKLKSRDKRKEVFKKIANIKEDACVLLDSFKTQNTDETISDLIEILITENYFFDRYKAKKEEKKNVFYLYGDLEVEDVIKKTYYISKGINYAKDLVNTPYNYLNAEKLANEAMKLSEVKGVCVKIYNKPQIEEMNMGLFLGVNKGSTDEPKLIYIKYQGKDSFDDPVALIGKGVMYDSGGYSLKPSNSMPGMKGDMAGAAAVIAAIGVIAKLEMKVNVMVIVAATDNRIGDNAIVPDDILTSAKGITVEIISTDAEGRLTLADALWFAQKEGAKKLIDVATLTGAVIASIGKEFTGAFTNSRPFLESFKKATIITDEPIWELPLSKAFHKEIKSSVADIKNKGDKYAGASTAAAFLEEFVEPGSKWIHLDIAGTSENNNQATGVMVKSFVEFLSK